MDAAKAIESARKAIAANGATVILVTTTDSVPGNPGLPWRGEETGEVEVEAVAVFLGVKRGHTTSDADTAVQGRVMSGRVKDEAIVLMAAAGLFQDPQVNDQIQVSDDEPRWRISNVEKLAPAGTSILYKLTVER